VSELSARLDRWLYRGGRPNRLARLMVHFWACVFARGWIMPDRVATLEVVGRCSGRPVALPVVVADFEGGRYLVSMLGEKANWVRNVRAADGRAVLRHGRQEKVRLVEVDVGARAPVLRRYLSVAPGARAHIPVDRHASLPEFEQIADRFPVFRITAS